jgi:hypothetical protein
MGRHSEFPSFRMGRGSYNSSRLAWTAVLWVPSPSLLDPIS